MSGKQKRPAMRRPADPNRAIGTAASKPAKAAGAEGCSSGLLGDLLGSLAETQARVAKGAAAKPSLQTGVEKAAAEREAFEQACRRQLKAQLGSDTPLDATLEYDAMDKPHRALLSELAEEMGFYAQTVGEEDEGRRVIVAKQPHSGSVAEAVGGDIPRPLGVPARSKGRPPQRAPPAPPAHLTKLGIVKRDLRTVEEVQRDMKRQRTAASP